MPLKCSDGLLNATSKIMLLNVICGKTNYEKTNNNSKQENKKQIRQVAGK